MAEDQSRERDGAAGGMAAEPPAKRVADGDVDLSQYDQTQVRHRPTHPKINQ